jgi:hypothetical protein
MSRRHMRRRRERVMCTQSWLFRIVHMRRARSAMFRIGSDSREGRRGASLVLAGEGGVLWRGTDQQLQLFNRAGEVVDSEITKNVK